MECLESNITMLYYFLICFVCRDKCYQRHYCTLLLLEKFWLNSNGTPASLRNFCNKEDMVLLHRKLSLFFLFSIRIKRDFSNTQRNSRFTEECFLTIRKFLSISKKLRENCVNLRGHFVMGNFYFI